MGFFTKSDRNKKQTSSPKAPAEATSNSRSEEDSDETNPQEVGIVSGLLRDAREKASVVPDGDIVARRFGPASTAGAAAADAPAAGSVSAPSGDAARSGAASVGGPAESASDSARRLSAVPDEPTSSKSEANPPVPNLEIDPMAHIGSATTITGDIVAEEDLEIQGTIEGTVQLLKHKVTIGEEGVVKARVEAGTVVVMGRVEGDVSAAEIVEVQVGGYIGGNVKAPRVILQDGAIVIGGLDMSAGLPSADANANRRRELPPVKTQTSAQRPTSPPTLKEVEPLADELDFDAGAGKES